MRMIQTSNYMARHTSHSITKEKSLVGVFALTLYENTSYYYSYSPRYKKGGGV